VNTLEIVRAAARKLNLLDEHGKLIELDSLAVIDLVLELEAATRKSIPTASLRQEAFASLETVAAMLDELNE
jgi:acyl carrier protein